ncbi:MAG: hypothetical protein U1E28_23105 [Beijerinckiaceae bacterium]
MSGRIVRIAGPLIGVTGAIAAFVVFGGAWGFFTGFAIFIAATTFSELYWQAGAEPDEIRKDLEDRVRNPPS